MSLEEILTEISKLDSRDVERVRRVLNEQAVNGRSVYEVAGHLFDGVDDLPADLSTNPKYLEGFGR